MPPHDPIEARAYLLFIAERSLNRSELPQAGASDLVQTALLQAHTQRKQFRGASAGEYRGWLRRILFSVMARFRRRQQRHGTASFGVDLLATNDSPSGPVQQAEQREQLAQALGQLPEEQRRIIILRVEHQLPFAVIGEQLGKSADAVRMNYHRGLEQLRSLVPSP